MAKSRTYKNAVTNGIRYEYFLNGSGLTSSGSRIFPNGKVVNHTTAFADSDGSRPTTYSILEAKLRSEYNSFSQSEFWSGGVDAQWVLGTLRTASGASYGSPLSTYLENTTLGFYTLSDYSGPPVFMPVQLSADLDRQILGRLGESSIALGDIFAELSETVTYIASRGVTLAKFGTCLLSGRWSSALRHIGITKRKFNKIRSRSIGENGFQAAVFTSRAWVELGFAIRPLVGDISTAAELYSNPELLQKNYRFVSSTSVSFSESSNDTYPSSYQSVNIRASCSGTARCKVVYQINDPDVLAKKALGLNSPLGSIWEGLPFSWLVDYVVNVGDFLQDLTATRGLTFAHGYKSIRFNHLITASSAFVRETLRPYSARYTDRIFSDGTTDVKGYGRTILNAFPKPSLTTVVDEFNTRKASYVVAVGTILTNNYLQSRRS